MFHLSFDNLHSIDPAHGISKDELTAVSNRIPDYLKKIKARDQGFYSVVHDGTMSQRILDFANSIEGRYDDVVVLGIGGSALGTICLQQSLSHLFVNEGPRLHVLDNIDPSLLFQIEDVISLPRTLFIVVTKSGGTPETLAQYFYFQKRCLDQGLAIAQHFVFVTDPERGLLRKISRETQHVGRPLGAGSSIPTFEIPPNVGGRFSVLTSVGLLPAALIGIDIEALLRGAQSMRDHFLSAHFDKNLPFQVAAVQYLLGQKGKIMNVMLPYSHRLIRFADWYRQLLAESIGKAQNERGETVHVGLTPINALGVTDQHSQSQLYNEGPNDKLFLFIEVDDLGPTLPIPNPYPDDETVNFLNGVTFNKLMRTEKQATEQSLTQNDRPNLTLRIRAVDAEHLGALFMLFEGATAFLGEFYEINAFDQPGVELSKTLTKQLLRERP